MSLSQKHTGLILVPWFNSAEWHFVYHLAYSSYREKQLEALDLLKLWKIRTPILSTGVEGTLILLDALLMNSESMSEEDVANMYAIALMRFLNLSAANADKQGSFTKTSFKNELPKWLINLRHDVAHGHQIPSSHSLKMGLDFGLTWLKEKYWEPQSKSIRDYSVGETPDLGDQICNYLKFYVKINMAKFENEVLSNAYIELIRATIYERFKKSVKEPHKMGHIMLEMITQSLEADPEKLKRSLNELISPGALLKPYFELQEDSNSEVIAKEFRDIWGNLLNVFHQGGALFITIEKLFDVVGNISAADVTKKMAALWINEMLASLHHLKENKSLDAMLKLESSRHTYTEQSLNFQMKVMQHSNQFTSYFLDSLLVYNSRDEEFSKDMVNLLNAKCNAQGVHEVIDGIYLLEDLNIESLNSEEEILTEKSTAEKIIASNKWKKIENTTMFKNCPLGVLPHQIGQTHPFLILS